MIETRIYQRGQTTIPAVYRKKYNLTQNDVMEWDENEKGEIIISFRKKVTIDEMIGSLKTEEKTNSVELVRRIYNE